MPRCLWISRELPFPLDAGDRIYSANLARALADAGWHVRFMGLGDAAMAVPTGFAAVDWRPVASSRRSKASALLSSMPNQAAVHATRAYRAALLGELRTGAWDAIVLDSYASGWALDHCRRIDGAAGLRRPLLVHVSHNHEAAAWTSMADNARGRLLRRLLVRQNAWKTARFERRLMAAADVITAITEEDSQAFGRSFACARRVTLTPGFTGIQRPRRTIGETTPRRVILVGSFRWIVKQENLRQFLAVADPRFAANGIHCDVAGDVPAALRQSLQGQLRATTLHGFVEDLGPLFDAARVAVVPELIGGGFKLKFLDYFFARVPVACIEDSAAGLPEAMRACLLRGADAGSLVQQVVQCMDDLQRLNALQDRAYSIAAASFNWRDRGLVLARAMEAGLDPGPAVPEPA